MPVTLASAVSWLLLTVGAALFVGTAAALVTYRRSGAMPGGVEPAPSALRGAVVKCLVGLAGAVVGVIGLSVYGTAI